jgi:hypothetical protein
MAPQYNIQHHHATSQRNIIMQPLNVEQSAPILRRRLANDDNDALSQQRVQPPPGLPARHPLNVMKCSSITGGAVYILQQHHQQQQQVTNAIQQNQIHQDPAAAAGCPGTRVYGQR